MLAPDEVRDGVAERLCMRRADLDPVIASITGGYMHTLEVPTTSPVRGDRAPATQRARILDVVVRVVAERGFAGATVKLVIGRAGVSRRAFYECFDGLEECVTAVIDEGYERAHGLIVEAFAGETLWLDGVRAALAALLVFFDSERELSWVLLVEATAAGVYAREQRERYVVALTSMIERRWGWGVSEHRSHALDTAGVMASLLGVLHSHLVRRDPRPLIELLGPMMGLVTAPYLGAKATAREVARGNELARALRTRSEDPRHGSPHARSELGPAEEGREKEDARIPPSLRDPRAHRARRCVIYLVGHPGASNREIAQGVGIARDTQISTLLARLTAMGVLIKRSAGAGHPNVWRLTPMGEHIAALLLREPTSSRVYACGKHSEQDFTDRDGASPV
jgi:AcrR family transcriptional regulator